VKTWIAGVQLAGENAAISIILAISVASESGPICPRKFEKPAGVMNMSRRARVDLALRKVSMLLRGQEIVSCCERCHLPS